MYHPDPIEVPTDPHDLARAIGTLAVFDTYPSIEDDADYIATALPPLTTHTALVACTVPVFGGSITTYRRVIRSGAPR
jgi:hypothetical protein